MTNHDTGVLQQESVSMWGSPSVKVAGVYACCLLFVIVANQAEVASALPLIGEDSGADGGECHGC